MPGGLSLDKLQDTVSSIGKYKRDDLMVYDFGRIKAKKREAGPVDPIDICRTLHAQQRIAG